MYCWIIDVLDVSRNHLNDKLNTINRKIKTSSEGVKPPKQAKRQEDTKICKACHRY